MTANVNVGPLRSH